MSDADSDLQRLLSTYRIVPSDRDRIRRLGAAVVPRVGEVVALFYEWLDGQPEFGEFFSDPALLARVRKLQEEYWRAFFEARLDGAYLDGRRRIGEVHARIGLSLPVYFAAMNFSLTAIAERFADGIPPAELAGILVSVGKLIHLDTAVVVETYARLMTKRLSDQSRALMEMSTPVTALWQDILMLPLVGFIDSRRAQDIMNVMLAKIAETRSRLFILDISGVAVVDTAVANHLIKITKATRLMGCDCTISGISPAIAQTVVELGIEVGDIRTTATLRDAVEGAFRRLGLELRVRGADGR